MNSAHTLATLRRYLLLKYLQNCNNLRTVRFAYKVRICFSKLFLFIIYVIFAVLIAGCNVD
jgi:hypothetical protein